MMRLTVTALTLVNEALMLTEPLRSIVVGVTVALVVKLGIGLGVGATVGVGVGLLPLLRAVTSAAARSAVTSAPDPPANTDDVVLVAAGTAVAVGAAAIGSATEKVAAPSFALSWLFHPGAKTRRLTV